MRVVTRPNLGGPMRQAIALWHAHRELGLRTLLVTGVVAADEARLCPSEGGVPRVDAAAVARGDDAEGWLELPSLQPGVTPWADRQALRALRRLMMRWRPEVVHTHTSKAGWIGRRAARAARVQATVHTFHGHVLQDYFGRVASAWLRHLERRLARHTQALVAVSASCADELAAAGIAARARFVVVPPAVPRVAALPRNVARDRLGIPRDAFRIAAVGRLVPIKRLEHFVDVLALRPDWQGDVFGDGRERDALRARSAAIAPGRLHLRGAVAEVASLLPAFDALVLPSVREGCPLVAVEAFRAGVPVVGYDVPGVRDVLGPWGGGRLVPPAAGPTGLAAAVARVAAEPAETAALVARARAGADRFLPAAVAERLVSVYRAARGAAGGYASPAKA